MGLDTGLDEGAAVGLPVVANCCVLTVPTEGRPVVLVAVVGTRVMGRPLATATEGRRVGTTRRLLPTGLALMRNSPRVGRNVGPVRTGRITGTGVGLKVRTLRGRRDGLAATDDRDGAAGLRVLRAFLVVGALLGARELLLMGVGLLVLAALGIVVVGTGLGIRVLVGRRVRGAVGMVVGTAVLGIGVGMSVGTALGQPLKVEGLGEGLREGIPVEGRGDFGAIVGRKMSSSATFNEGIVVGARVLLTGALVLLTRLQGMRVLTPLTRVRHIGTFEVGALVPPQRGALATELVTTTSGWRQEMPTVADGAAKLSHPLGQRLDPMGPRHPSVMIVQPAGHLPTILDRLVPALHRRSSRAVSTLAD